MVLSQAREIVATYGGAAALAVGATTGITGAIAPARIGGGWLGRSLAVPHVMCRGACAALSGGLLLTLFPAPPLRARLGPDRHGLRLRLRPRRPAASASTAARDYGRIAGRTTSPGAWRGQPGRCWPATCSD